LSLSSLDRHPRPLLSFPTRRSSDLILYVVLYFFGVSIYCAFAFIRAARRSRGVTRRRMEAISLGSILLGTDILIAGLTPLARPRSEEHTSELQSRVDLVCRLLLEKK